MPQMVSEQDLLTVLREACAVAGSQSKWAKAAGVSGAFVSQVLNNRNGKRISPKMAKKLGYTRSHPTRSPRDQIVMFVRIGR